MKLAQIEGKINSHFPNVLSQDLVRIYKSDEKKDLQWRNKRRQSREPLATHESIGWLKGLQKSHRNRTTFLSRDFQARKAPLKV